MSKLVLIRHGQSEWNALNLFNGWVDTKLSPKGIEQAQTAGQLLKAEGIDFDIAFTSLLTRAIQTLNITLEEIGQLWIPEAKSWRLNERHYGALQGLNKQDAADKWGDEQVHEWRRSYDTLPPLQEEITETKEVSGVSYPEIDRRYNDLDAKTIPGGENLKVTLERVIPFWQDSIAPQLKDNKNVIIAAHGNSLRALMKYIEDINDDDIMGLELANGVPVVYEFDDNLKLISKKNLEN